MHILNIYAVFKNVTGLPPCPSTPERFEGWRAGRCWHPLRPTFASRFPRKLAEAVREAHPDWDMGSLFFIIKKTMV